MSRRQDVIRETLRDHLLAEVVSNFNSGEPFRMWTACSCGRWTTRHGHPGVNHLDHVAEEVARAVAVAFWKDAIAVLLGALLVAAPALVILVIGTGR